MMPKKLLLTCACQSGLLFSRCCDPYLQGAQLPPTPEALMRSRYVAYTRVDIDYIQRTMRGPALRAFNRQRAKRWAQQAQWLSLTILQAPRPALGNTQGIVEFIADYRVGQQQYCLHELSQFEYDEGQWFYVDGKTL